MDRAQTLAFTPAGCAAASRVPSYVANGNHDGLVQGNEDAQRRLRGHRDRLLQGRSASRRPAPAARARPEPAASRRRSACWCRPTRAALRRPSRRSRRSTGAATRQRPRLRLRRPGREAASNGSASYYAWDPPKRRASASSRSTPSPRAASSRSPSDGNIDDPQFQWLRRELDTAPRPTASWSCSFGHHPVRSLDSHVPDEAAPCTGATTEQPTATRPARPRRNPGCDLDPRTSTPVHQRRRDLRDAARRLPAT